jgi:tRNA(adenine34) deaminase
MPENIDKAIDQDRFFMQLAIEQAVMAGQRNEVPIGAVIVDRSGNMLAAAGNSCISDNDPAAHAEMLVLRTAGRKLNNYRLGGTTLYVTVEPCPMCAAALVHARVKRLVFGAYDPKGGGISSQYAIGSDGKLNHTLEWQGGILQRPCAELMVDFFRQRRKK